MLSPKEFSVGPIGETSSGITLVLPSARHEESMLVTHALGSPYVVFLSGDHRFTGFECSRNTSWTGILIPNVAIEIDEQSAVDADNLSSTLGTLIRKGTQLCMVTRLDGGMGRSTKTLLVEGLPACAENMTATFSRWRIVLGDGPTKRELMHIEIGKRQTA